MEDGLEIFKMSPTDDVNRSYAVTNRLERAGVARPVEGERLRLGKTGVRG